MSARQEPSQSGCRYSGCYEPGTRTIEVPPMNGYGFPAITGVYCDPHAAEVLVDRLTFPGAKDVTDER